MANQPLHDLPEPLAGAMCERERTTKVRVRLLLAMAWLAIAAGAPLLRTPLTPPGWFVFGETFAVGNAVLFLVFAYFADRWGSP